MKKIITLFVMLPLLFAVGCSTTSNTASNANGITPLDHKEYGNYYVKNTVEPKDQMIFLASKDLDQFKIYMGSGATMGSQDWITADMLDAKGMIVAVIDENTNDTDWIKIVSIHGKGDTVYVKYDMQKSEPKSYYGRAVAVSLTNGEGVKSVIFEGPDGSKTEAKFSE